MLQNSQEKACARVSILIKLQAWGLFFTEHVWATAFLSARVNSLKKTVELESPTLLEKEIQTDLILRISSAFWRK